MWFRIRISEDVPCLVGLVGGDGQLYFRVSDIGRLLGYQSHYSFAKEISRRGRDVLPPDYRSKLSPQSHAMNVRIASFKELTHFMNENGKSPRTAKIACRVRYLFDFGFVRDTDCHFSKSHSSSPLLTQVASDAKHAIRMSRWLARFRKCIGVCFRSNDETAVDFDPSSPNDEMTVDSAFNDETTVDSSSNDETTGDAGPSAFNDVTTVDSSSNDETTGDAGPSVSNEETTGDAGPSSSNDETTGDAGSNDETTGDAGSSVSNDVTTGDAGCNDETTGDAGPSVSNDRTATPSVSDAVASVRTVAPSDNQAMDESQLPAVQGTASDGGQNSVGEAIDAKPCSCRKTRESTKRLGDPREFAQNMVRELKRIKEDIAEIEEMVLDRASFFF